MLIIYRWNLNLNLIRVFLAGFQAAKNRLNTMILRHIVEHLSLVATHLIAKRYAESEFLAPVLFFLSHCTMTLILMAITHTIFVA